ncbi:MAG: hypothetical protein OHK0053_13720 [Microscillaceae bacterium]
MTSEPSSNGPLTFEKPSEGPTGSQLALEPSQFVQILEGCADAVVVADHQGCILFFNEAAERLFQYRREEIQGQNVRLLMPDVHAHQHDQYMQNYLRTGEAKIIGKGRELDARRKDGTMYPILLTISESRDAQHRFFAAFIKDNREKREMESQIRQQLEEVRASEEEIRQNMEELQATQEKQEKLAQDLRESEAELQAQFHAINTAYSFVGFSPEGLVLEANTHFLRTMGYDRLEEIKGQHHRIFVDPVYAQSPAYRQFWASLQNGQSFTGTYQRYSRDGQEVWVDGAYSPVFDEQRRVVKVIKLARDVTDFTLALKASGRFLEQLRKGNFEAKMELNQRKVSGDIEEMIQNNIALRDTLKNILADVNRVVQLAGKEGRLAERLRAEGHEGAWRTLTESLNELLENIHQPLREMQSLLANLAQGNLTRRFEQVARGDVREMSESLNTALHNLNQLLHHLEKNALMVASASQQMKNKAQGMRESTREASAAIQEMADGAQEQANRIDESSRKVEETLHAAQQVSQKAESIHQAAEKGKQASLSGLGMVQSLVENMDTLSQSASTTASAIEILTTRSEEISRILNVINDIAFQTKLLSVNAAIEAARAGEAGRSFQVVADEIGKLAEDSRQATVEIEKVIKDVQKDIQKSTQAVTQMKGGVEKGHQASQKVSEAFTMIDASSADTLAHSRSILLASQQQKEAIDAVVRNIEKIVVVSEQTASGTQEVASSSREMDKAMAEVTQTSEHLAQIAEELKAQVGQFQLSPTV